MEENKYLQYIGKRVVVNEQIATVKFAGPLAHEGRPENSENQLWFGVEWDDATRGKHNGTVKDHKYFETTGNQNSGSLIKEGKGSFGINVLDGIFAKYFKDGVGEDLKEQVKSKLFADEEGENGDNSQQKENAKAKEVTVEIDEDVYFETFKKQKKMVEFYGFDKIWSKLHNMKELLEISLYQVNISDFGKQGYFAKILPNLRVLSLERNLIYDWNQVFQIGSELKNLEELQIARNFIRKIGPIDEVKTIKCMNDGSEIEQSPVGVFAKLKYLNFIEMGLDWKQVNAILPAFPYLEDLILCINDLTDTENIQLRDSDLQRLSFLNLESASLQNFEGICKGFGQLPNLEKLILNKNKFKELGKFQGFEKVNMVSLEKNLIEDPKICYELSQFKNLQTLNIKHNPMQDSLGKSYVRQRSVAENFNITFINGSDLKKYERKDCEIFYLRRTFDDYFKLRNSVYYDYDFEDFKKWAFQEHPTIKILLEKYGNPYEQMDKQQQQVNEEGVSVPKNVMLKLKIVIAAGPLLGKNPLNKKFPENTTVQTLKNVFSKLLQIPADEQMVYYKVNEHDPMEILDEDHKIISNYGIKDGSEIIVSDQQN